MQSDICKETPLTLWGCLFKVSPPLYQSMLILDLRFKILEREIKHSHSLRLRWVRHLSQLCLLYSGHCSVPTASTNNEAKHAKTIQQWEKVSAEMGFTNWSAISWPNQKASIWRFGLFQKSIWEDEALWCYIKVDGWIVAMLFFFSYASSSRLYPCQWVSK